MVLLDGALQAYLPSFSTLTLVCVAAVLMQVLLNRLAEGAVPLPLLYGWIAACAALFLYPMFGLALERAPARAYLVILSGPLYILWRTGLALAARFSRQPAIWVRTAHGETK
jgi:hypothetical protein